MGLGTPRYARKGTPLKRLTRVQWFASLPADTFEQNRLESPAIAGSSLRFYQKCLLPAIPRESVALCCCRHNPFLWSGLLSTHAAGRRL